MQHSVVTSWSPRAARRTPHAPAPPPQAPTCCCSACTCSASRAPASASACTAVRRPTHSCSALAASSRLACAGGWSTAAQQRCCTAAVWHPAFVRGTMCAAGPAPHTHTHAPAPHTHLQLLLQRVVRLLRAPARLRRRPLAIQRAAQARSGGALLHVRMRARVCVPLCACERASSAQRRLAVAARSCMCACVRACERVSVHAGAQWPLLSTPALTCSSARSALCSLSCSFSHSSRSMLGPRVKDLRSVWGSSRGVSRGRARQRAWS